MSRPRRPRVAPPRGESVAGRRLTVDVGAVAHGGHCVARSAEPESRVIFVRHTLPGERVVVELTEGTEGDRFWRGDAVEILTASPDRVVAPCPFSGPQRCGGCDFQHVALPAQRELKAAVVREQLTRLARLPVEHPAVAELVVEEVPPLDGLRWRSRVGFVPLPGGALGLHAHRSRAIVEVDDCLIGTEAAVADWRADERVPLTTETVSAGGTTHEFEVAADGFWQPHAAAPSVLVNAVMDFLRPQPGERALDLYAGVGVFARFLLDAVGSRGSVTMVEAERAAADCARHNLPQLPGVGASRVLCGVVERVLSGGLDEPFDLVVLDPPRAGAKRKVVEQIADRAPRAIAYVACDPAALARDIAFFAEFGYELTGLRSFDLFPMTHHVECVALLTKTGPDLR
ncbi:MAG: TRAM domain-containing protein [Nocardioides sp.]